MGGEKKRWFDNLNVQVISTSSLVDNNVVGCYGVPR